MCCGPLRPKAARPISVRSCLDGTKSKLNVTTEFQIFGLVVTAEPYYAVTQPSDLIVLENSVRPDTKGKIEEIDAKYELFSRGQYQHLANPLALKFDSKQPLELYEAPQCRADCPCQGEPTALPPRPSRKPGTPWRRRRPTRIARPAGSPSSMTAREAVQTAEDSRAIAVKRQESERSGRRTAAVG